MSNYYLIFGRSHLALILILALCFGVTACANPSYHNVSPSLGNVNFSTLAILPFTGEEKYAALATETFTLHLIGLKNVKMLQPNDVRLTIIKMGLSTSGDITVLEATKVAKSMGATAIILGNASGYTNGVTLNGFATVKIIDANNGEIVAAVHEPSGLLFAYSVEQSVLAAVENVAKKIRQLIENWSSKSVPSKTSGNSI